MYKDILIQANLSPNEAVVYEYLLKNGESPAGLIIKKTPLKRGVVYNALADLINKGLAVKKMRNKVALFSPNHPGKLREYLEQHEAEILKAKNNLEANLSALISDFNLVSSQPGVRFYEGIAGIKKVLDDTIKNNPQKKILCFSDVAGYAKYLKDWNTGYYAPARKNLNIYEKVIIPDNQAALEYMKGYKSNEVTEVMFIDHKIYPFATEINIYNNRIALVSFSEKALIGVIIESREMHDTLTSVFNFCWELGRRYCAEIQPEWIKNFGLA